MAQVDPIEAGGTIVVDVGEGGAVGVEEAESISQVQCSTEVPHRPCGGLVPVPMGASGEGGGVGTWMEEWGGRQGGGREGGEWTGRGEGGRRGGGRPLGMGGCGGGRWPPCPVYCPVDGEVEVAEEEDLFGGANSIKEWC